MNEKLKIKNEKLRVHHRGHRVSQSILVQSLRSAASKLCETLCTLWCTPSRSAALKLCGTLCTLWCISLLASCDRRDITYYEVCEISLHVDWSQSGLDSEEGQYGATAVFYPTDGDEPIIFRMGDRSMETVRLTEGVYNVILFNRSFNDFSNISFRGIDRYQTLEAYARKVETRVDETTRAETRVIIGSPDDLAVASYEGLTITEDMLGNYSETTYGRSPRTANDKGTYDLYKLRLTPCKLTREVVALLHITGLNNIRSAKCRLEGVAESVFLASGRYSEHTMTQEFAPTNPEFTPGSPFNGTLTGSFGTFGSDFSDTHRLHLEALLVDGKTTFKGDYDDARVTEKDNGEGTVIIHVEVNTDKIPDVKPESGSDSGFDVDVDGWGNDINTDIPID